MNFKKVQVRIFELKMRLEASYSNFQIFLENETDK